MFAALQITRPLGLRHIMIGEKLPDLSLTLIRNDPKLQSTVEHLPTLLTGKRTLMISHPGAFTFQSTGRMFPEYAEKRKDLEAAGITQVLAFSVNDKFVLETYVRKHGFGISMLSDWNGDLTHALELGLPEELYFAYIARRAIFLVDETATVLGIRSEENVQYTRLTSPASALSMSAACFGPPT